MVIERRKDGPLMLEREAADRMHAISGDAVKLYLGFLCEAQDAREETFYTSWGKMAVFCGMEEAEIGDRLEELIGAGLLIRDQGQVMIVGFVEYTPPVASKDIPSHKRKPKKGYVYLAEADNGTYKIGQSIRPEERIRTIGVKLPYALKVNHVIPTDDMEITECILHDMFATKRVGGEWFELDAFDVETIKTIENGAELDG